MICSNGLLFIFTKQEMKADVFFQQAKIGVLSVICVEDSS